MNEKQDTISSRMSYKTPAILALAILILFFPYLLASSSTTSICFRKGGISTGPDKIESVIGQLERYLSHPPLQARIPGCCSVDRGGGDFEPLTLEDFITLGKTHYVHVNTSLFPDYRRAFLDVNRNSIFVTVDGCGNITRKGR